MSTINGSQSLDNGFTLVELLVIIAIIAILITLGIVSFQEARLKSLESCADGNIESCCGSMTPSEAREKLEVSGGYTEFFSSALECGEEFSSCEVECADDAIPGLLDDCLRRCEIKMNYCEL